MTGKELRAIRKRLGWTQAQLAARIGVAANSVARQERGEVRIRKSLALLVRMIADKEASQATSSKRTRGGQRGRQHGMRS
jgi:transcriptional regulator with XRE-family HTH domain